MTEQSQGGGGSTDQGGAGTLPHLTVSGRAVDQPFRGQSNPRSRSRTVDRQVHGSALLEQATEAVTTTSAEAVDLPTSLVDAAVTITLVGPPDGLPLKLSSVDSARRPPDWVLLRVEEGPPEKAVVRVADTARAKFLQRFQDYLERDTRTGKPKNAALVENIDLIRRTVLEDLWSSNTPLPDGLVWWELWLREPQASTARTGLGAPRPGSVSDARRTVESYAAIKELRLAPRDLILGARRVVWLEATREDLLDLPFSTVPLAELRRPLFADTVEDFEQEELDELLEDLEGRVRPAPLDAPAVLLLDRGVLRTHVLLHDFLAETDHHSVVDDNPTGRDRHGTQMASLSLLGPLGPLLTGTQQIDLEHRLESVRFITENPLHHGQDAYGLVTSEAVAAAEVGAPARRRVICMPVTTPPDGRPGEPTLWSATLDALAVGTDISSSPTGIALVGLPDPDASRLFFVSAGNVHDHPPGADHLDVSDASAAEDPAQAWNAVTVGAHTELSRLTTEVPQVGWTAIAAPGELSPHSRTSVLYARKWPVKPDVCFEGGNILTDGSLIDDRHPVVSLQSATNKSTTAIGSVNATSAATAQAAGLAATVVARYPAYWPETVRGLIVHGARWTPRMLKTIQAQSGKRDREALLRRYGWGVPTAKTVLDSAVNAVTLVTQDSFQPFDDEFKMRRFRLHALPWPQEQLADLGSAVVELRTTLSYFVEPNASRRGWRDRYTYPSHLLRFELRSPTETHDNFIARVGHQAVEEEQNNEATGVVAALHQTARPSVPGDASGRWLVGANQRNRGSLHQDVWNGTGAELASCAESPSIRLADGGKTTNAVIGRRCPCGTRSSRLCAPKRQVSTSTPPSPSSSTFPSRRRCQSRAERRYVARSPMAPARQAVSHA